VERRLDVPLLARIPAPPRQLRSEDQLVMIADPRSQKAEPFRVLRTNLEYVTLNKKPKTIVVTSALEGEGKSTTAANLAVSLARAGQHVVLVDLDLRRPYLDRFFFSTGNGNRRPTLTDVALGHANLESALAAFTFSGFSGTRAANGNGSAESSGLLEVLGAGPMPPNPGEFTGSQAVRDILATLAQRASFVIIDTAPLLGVGDTLTLAKSVDAMVLVTRLNRLRKPVLAELGRLLDSTPVDVLGFVVTDAEAEEHYGYYGYGYKDQRGREVYGEEAPQRQAVPAEGRR
jgi:non-specific protein-tyrosine kinase